jgi:hypothetical protein
MDSFSAPTKEKSVMSNNMIVPKRKATDAVILFCSVMYTSFMRVSQSSPVASKHSSNENKKIASSAYTAAVIVTRLSPP